MMGVQMTRALYLDDSYLRECDATVVSVTEGKFVVLDRTVFYPKGGGQPGDTGTMIRDEAVFNVVNVGRFAGAISHEVDPPGLREQDRVRCVLNWPRRYRLMQSHTAAHVFAALLCRGTGALITGNQLAEDKIRFDFSLEDYDPDVLERYVEETNQLLGKDIPVRWYELPKADALKIPGVIKMADALPPDIPSLRIVEITGVDRQADGGTHVRNLNEVRHIRILKTENKGKNNRRVYFAFE